MTPRPARKTETAAKRRSRSPGKDQAQPCLGGSSSLVVLAGGCCARPRTTPPPTTPGRADEMVICARVTGSSDQPQFPSPGP